MNKYYRQPRRKGTSYIHLNEMKTSTLKLQLNINIYIYIKHVFTERRCNEVQGAFSCLTDQRRPNAPPDALLALRRPRHVGKV